jgi:hypothetical protein
MACIQFKFRFNIREAQMMPKINRLTGRFFAVLISLSLAILLPRAGFAAGGSKSPSPTLCQISDTVYRADGTPAQGTVLLSWPAFTTAAGQAVSPGSLLVTLDANGGFNASVAPNTGASPAGTYYKAIFKLSDGTSETEYWVVPNAQTTTIGAIRSKLVPAQQAAQFLTRDFADSNYVSLASAQSITGVKTFSTSPAVPTPVNPTDAANKSYVDANSGSGILASPPPIGSGTPNSGAFTVLTAQDSQTANFPVMDLRNYGMVGDGQILSTCSITSAQKIMQCAGASFSNRDVGKGAFFQGAGASGGFLNSTIASVQSSTQITLSSAAGTTVSSGTFYYGTDNTTAWCAAVNCNSATVPNQLATPQPGRTLRLPRGTYFVSGTIYTRNGDVLVGDGGTATEIYQFDATGSKDLLQMGANATGGGTLDNGGLLNVVKGILFAQPEATTGSCVNTMNASGVDVIDNWFFCNVGILAQGNGLRLLHNTCDLNNGQCVIVKGNGAQTNNPTHSVLIQDTDCYANRYACFQVGGATDVLLNHNFINYAKQFGLYLASPSNQTSYRVVATDNSFITSTSSGYYTSTQTHIYMSTPCVDCQISNGNKFMLSRQYDIDLENSGITGLKIMGNQFYGGQGNSLNVGQAGSGLTLQNNNFDSPGSYAADFNGAAVISGNYCHAPFAVAGLPANDYDKACFRFANSNAAGSKASDNVTDSTTAAAVAFRGGAFPAYSSGNRSGWATTDVYVYTGAGNIIASANERAYNGTGVTSVFTTMSDPSTGNANFAGNLTYQGVTGVHYLVSHYGSIQAAINAAYGSGVVSGVVVDDRTAAYTGAGFNIPDSVTVQLAPVTYTISSTVTFNNGNNSVTAGVIVQPGAHLIGQSTSSNHGTILQPGNSLNADLIASSTVGTGTGTGVQWWHWGELANLRILGNGANQTSGDCIKIENMGETARVHDIELSGCYLNNVEFIGASATQSAVSDITTNRSANGSGVAFTNLSGVAVLNGISGDCNQVALISSNQNSAGTLQITGLKAEGESSICSGAVQDPVILSTTTSSTVAASIKVDGGYAFGTSQVNFLKSTGPGTIQFTLNNFYLNGYTNILNDTVRGAVIANLSTTTKQPVSYLSNGVLFGNQAFTFQPNTFMQGNPNGTPTEIFGLGSDSATDIAAAGNGDNTKYFTGGVKFGTFNRTIFGQSPEFQARMGWRWTNPGYDTTTWTFIPIWATGDTSARWIGDPNQRWPEVYAADVNSTTATVGTLTVTTCNGCGGSFQQVNSDWNASSGVAQILNKPALATVATSGNYNDLSNKPAIPVQGAHLVSGTMQGNTATLTGNSADETIYSATLPAGTFTVGTGAHCWAKWQHTLNGSSAITYKWTLGATTVAYAAFTSASQSVSSDIEVLTPSALTSQIINLSAVIAGNGFQAGQSYGNTGSENLANADTIKFTFNAGSGEQVKGMSFYCQTIQ